MSMTPAQTAALDRAIQHRALTRAAQTLMGICQGLLADGQLHDREIQFLSLWLRENTEAAQSWPGDQIARRVTEILADGVITDAERSDLLQLLEQLTRVDFLDTGAATPDGPTLPIDDDPSIVFNGRTFCFTGTFIFGTRPACERVVLKLGGTAADSVSRRLDYLVIGALASPQYFNTSYGRKIEKAVALQKEGDCELAIVSEQQWTAAMADARGG